MMAPRFFFVTTCALALFACGVSVMGSDSAPGNTTPPPSSLDGSSVTDGNAIDPLDAASANDTSNPIDAPIDVAPKTLPYVVLSEPALPALGTLVDLTAEGTVDWKHWGHKPSDTTSTQKMGGMAIGAYSFNPPVGSRAGYPLAFGWKDGAGGYPTMTTTDTTNFIGSLDLTYVVSIDTSSTPRTLTLYAGVTGGSAHVEVSLTDDTVPLVKSASVSSLSDTITGAKWVVEYATNANNARLSVRVIGLSAGSGAATASVILAAATLR